MHPYRVEKLAVGAALLLSDGTRLEGRLFLAPFSPNHSGPQTVADLMAEPGPTLPFQPSDGRFLLVGKSSVAAVRVTSAAEDEAGLLVRVPARLSLTGGHELSGALLGEAGAGERASDLLNAPGEGFELEGDGCTHWVAKCHMLTLEPGDA